MFITAVARRPQTSGVVVGTTWLPIRLGFVVPSALILDLALDVSVLSLLVGRYFSVLVLLRLGLLVDSSL